MNCNDNDPSVNSLCFYPENKINDRLLIYPEKSLT